MANYQFTIEPFLWSKSGTNPTESEATLGLQGGMALPAAFVNQQWKSTYDSIKEIHDKVEDGTIKSGDVLIAGSGNEITYQTTTTPPNLINSYIIGEDNTILLTQTDKSIAIFGDGNSAGNPDKSLIVGSSNGAVMPTNSAIFGSSNIGTTISNCMIAGDSNTTTESTECGATFGYDNYVSSYALIGGKRCKSPTKVSSQNATTGDVLIIGNGTDSLRSNALRVTAAGEVMGTQAYTASGADFAEMFEWIDGNTNNEDRRGLFVTLDGEKIRLATSDDDYILGVVSATPTIIGGAHTDDWQGKYKTDVFGVRLIENETWQLSDSFDETQDDNYTSRLDRPEWDAIGFVGKLVVVDDGTCQANGYCYPDENGIATATISGYRVMKRIDDSHILVVVK